MDARKVLLALGVAAAAHVTGACMAYHLGLKQQPDAAREQRMRTAGKGCLEQLLKVDADRVQLTAQGLVVR